ncbi:hypothetical protein B0O99DRAFT_311107 [Bisporella sp. PMI_857]|nr:hypothetical protein B0O99DRAFT_311107 [Bisporella sp. PMI_857]
MYGLLRSKKMPSKVELDSRPRNTGKRKALEVFGNGSTRNGQDSSLYFRDCSYTSFGLTLEPENMLKRPKVHPNKSNASFRCSQCNQSLSCEDHDSIVESHDTGPIKYPRIDKGSKSQTSSSSESSISRASTLDNGSDSDSGEPALTNDSQSWSTAASSRSSSSPPGCIPPIEPGLFYSDHFLLCDKLYKIPSTTADQTLILPADGVATVHEAYDREGKGKFESPSNNEYSEQESITPSTPRNNHSLLHDSSFSDNERASSSGDGSSESKTSSEAIDSDLSDELETPSCTDLEAVIKRVLRAEDPRVVKLVFEALNGKLECAPADPEAHFEESANKLSLLSLLDVNDTTPLRPEIAFTVCGSSTSSGSTPSSSGGGSSNNKDTTGSSSSRKNTGSSGDIPGGRGNSNSSDDKGDQNIKQKSTPAKNSAQDSEAYLFRCIHNVLAPDLFCVTHETKRKYSTCAGPGWNSIQHLKDHMKSHHTVKRSKANLLQCSRCQKTFKSKEKFDDHEVNDDCPIRCPICNMEFEQKSFRQTHRIKDHNEENSKLLEFIEIDEHLDKKLREALKAWGDSVKNKKGKGATDPAMEEWIERNIQRYMIGRQPTANARLELGQWYTMFQTLSARDVPKDVPEVVPEHPFYDFGIRASDLVTEKIIMINRAVIVSRISIHGAPPTEQEEQIAWYQSALNESLKLAAESRLVRRAMGSNQAQSSSSAYPDLGTDDIQMSLYESPALSAHHMNIQSSIAPSHASHMQSIGHRAPALEAQQSYHPDLRQGIPMMPTLSNGPYDTATPASTIINPSISNSPWLYTQSVLPNIGTSYPQETYGIPQDYSNYESANPDDQYTNQQQSHW